MIPKSFFYDKIADKLKAETLTAKDLWSTLKTVISPNSKSSIPALESNDIIYTNDRDKANKLSWMNKMLYYLNFTQMPLLLC